MYHTTHRLSDTLNVITKNLAVTLSTALSETLHVDNEYLTLPSLEEVRIPFHLFRVQTLYEVVVEVEW